jgi:mannose-6-phosphate isomerase-like protein (cupin superfamily)
MGKKYIFSTEDTLRYRFPTHTNDLVMDRSESETSEAFVVVLEPGEAPPLHIHHDTEQVFYVIRGHGVLQVGEDVPQFLPVNPTDLVRIPPHTPHRVRCEGQESLVYLSIDCFVGGRPTNEPTWESHVRVMCEQQGWDFDQVCAGPNVSG